MKVNFIPNWNGHLFLYEYDDKSVLKLFEKTNYKNKELIKIEKNNITNTNKIIENKFLEYSKDNKKENFILSICGDHSNSYSLIKAFSKNNKDAKIVIFDAHPDVEISTDIISHEDYLRNLIENKIIKSENIYLFGIRTFSRKEFEYLQNKNINFFTITDILNNKNKFKKLLKDIKNDIYLSIDIDVLDPNDAPGTYYKEWCGLKIEELIEFINILKPNIKSLDICEFYIEKDENNITENNVLKLIKNLLKENL